MARRRFLLAAACSDTVLLLAVAHYYHGDAAASEAALKPCPAPRLLPNGICLNWTTPPNKLLDPLTASEPPPYLRTPPSVINISRGRQLLVDSFLVDEDRTSDVLWEWHPVQYDRAHNPVVRPDRPWELCAPYANKTWRTCRTTAGESLPPGSPLTPNCSDGVYKHGFASTFSGGVWFDPADKVYKMFYSCASSTCVAHSSDAIHWRKPEFTHTADPGTNIVAADFHDGNTVWLDLETSDPQAKWKLASVPEWTRKLPDSGGGRYMMYNFYSSPDGVNFTLQQNHSGKIFDRSTLFYNPFRRKWVYSIKCEPHSKSGRVLWRSRCYWEGNDWLAGAVGWSSMSELLNWTTTDELDPLPLCNPGALAVPPRPLSPKLLRI
eukprot:COSAG05_NODE_158_length_15673_cov_23.898946_3_plen_379_part_00